RGALDRAREPTRSRGTRRDDARDVGHRRLPGTARPPDDGRSTGHPAHRAGAGGRRRGRVRCRCRRLHRQTVQPQGAGQPRRGGPGADPYVMLASAATTALVVLVVAAAALGTVIVFGRAVRRVREARRTRLAAPARPLLLAIAAGDADESQVRALVELP